MANRDLPNVYSTINDMSALIEGDDSLICGITLRANRGPVGVATNVQDSSDFLTRYTFTGKPGVKQDSTYFDIIELLKASNNIYVSRAANNPLYGGLIVKKEVEAGKLKGVVGTKDNYKTVLADGDVTAKVKPNTYIRVVGEDKNYGRFYVTEVQYVTPNTQITITESFEGPIVAPAEGGTVGTIYACTEPVRLTDITVADKFVDANADEKTVAVEGKLTYGNIGDRVRIKDAFYTIADLDYSQETTKTTIKFNEPVEALIDVVDAPIKLDSIAEPSLFPFRKDDLFLVTGIDQGAYNSSIGIELVSSNETELEEKDCFKLVVNNKLTGADM